MHLILESKGWHYYFAHFDHLDLAVGEYRNWVREHGNEPRRPVWMQFASLVVDSNGIVVKDRLRGIANRPVTQEDIDLAACHIEPNDTVVEFHD